MTSELDIARSANSLIERLGEAAVTHARQRVAELQATGDNAGADVWLRIIVAIDALRRDPGRLQ
jgi:hypothetical protein